MSEHTHHDKHEAHRQLVKRLRQHADDVRRFMTGLDEQTVAAHTVPGKWSLKEFVCHLDRAQQIFEGRVEAMLAADNPAFPSYSPDHDSEFEKLAARPGHESLAAYLERHEAFAERLDALTPAEWHRKGQHPEFPHYDVHFQVEYMIHHEAHHIYQMFQRRVPLGKLPH